MRIGIVSDTHSNPDAFRQVLRVFNERSVDCIIHCGDWTSPWMCDIHDATIPFYSVFGNCDYNQDEFSEKQHITFSDPLDIELGGARIGACHGDDPVQLREMFESGSFDLVCSGHTHRAGISTYADTTHINPGSPAKPKGSPSCAIFDTEKKKGEIVEL